MLLGEDCWQTEAALGSQGSIVYSITTIDLSEVRMLSTYDEQAARAEEWERYAGEQTSQIETLTAELAAARGMHEELQSMMENGADAGEVLQGELSSLRAQLVESQQAQLEAQAAAAEQAEAAEALTAQVGSLEARVASLTAQLEGEEADDEEAAAHAAEIEAAKAAAEAQLASALATAAADAARANAAEAALAEQAASIAELEAAGASGAGADDAAFAALREEVQHLRDQVNTVGASSAEGGPYDLNQVHTKGPIDTGNTVCVCSDFLFLVSEEESQVWRRNLNGREWVFLGATPAPFKSFVSNGIDAWACDGEGQVFYAAYAYGPSLEWAVVEMPEEAGTVLNLSMQKYDDKPMRVYAVTDAEENNAWMNSADGSRGWAQLSTPEQLLNMSSDGKHTYFVCVSGAVYKAPFSGSAEGQSTGEPLGLGPTTLAISDRKLLWTLTDERAMNGFTLDLASKPTVSPPGRVSIDAFDGFYFHLYGEGICARGYYGLEERLSKGMPADSPHGNPKSRSPKVFLNRADAAIISSVPAGYLRLFLNMAARTVSTGMLMRLQSAAFGGSLRCEDEEGQVVTSRGGGGGLTQIQVRPHPRNPLAVILQNRGNNRPQDAFQENLEHTGLVVSGSATPPSQFTPVWQSAGGRSNALALRTHSGRHVHVSASHAVNLSNSTSDATAFAVHAHKNNEF